MFKLNKKDYVICVYYGLGVILSIFVIDLIFLYYRFILEN